MGSDPSLQTHGDVFQGLVLCFSRGENDFMDKKVKGIRKPGVEVDPMGECSLIEAWENSGGTVVDFDDPTARRGVTHVVADHERQECFVWGKQQSRVLINTLWVWDCVRSQSVLSVADVVYKPFADKSIPGAEDYHLTVTGYQGHLRHVIQHLVKTLGFQLMLEMRLGRCTHVLAADVTDRSSKKVEAARGEPYKRGIKVVNTVWLLDCARRWRVLPSDNYLEPIPKEKDPFHGALLVDSGVEDIADTPEDSTYGGPDDQAGPPADLGTANIRGSHAPAPTYGLSMASAVISETASATKSTTAPTFTSVRRACGVAAGPVTTVPGQDISHDVRTAPEAVGTERTKSEPGVSAAAEHLLCNPKENDIPNCGSGGTSHQNALNPSDKRSHQGAQLRQVPVASPLSPVNPVLGGSEGLQNREGLEDGPRLVTAGMAQQENGGLLGGLHDDREGPFMLQGPAGSELDLGCMGLDAAEALTGKLVGELVPMSEINPGVMNLPGMSISCINTGAFPSRVRLDPMGKQTEGMEGGGTASKLGCRSGKRGAEAETEDRAPGPHAHDGGCGDPDVSTVLRTVTKHRTRGTVAADAEAGPSTTGVKRMRGRPRKGTPLVRTSAIRPVLEAIPSNSLADRQHGDAAAMEEPPTNSRPVSGPATRGRNTRKQTRTCGESDSSPAPPAEPVGQGVPARGKKRKLGAVSRLWDTGQGSPLAIATVPGNCNAPVAGVGTLLSRRNLRERGQLGPPAVSSHKAVRASRDASAAPSEGPSQEIPLASPPGEFDFLVDADKDRVGVNERHGPDQGKAGDAGEHHGAEPDGRLRSRRHEGAVERTPEVQEPWGGVGVTSREPGDAGESGGAETEGESDPEEADTPGQGLALAGGVPVSVDRSPGRRLSAPLTHGKRRPQRPLVLLCGMHTEEQQDIIRTLSAYSIVCKPREHRGWPAGVTHVVEPKLRRSEKSLAAMASGCWLVSRDFVAACQSCRGLAEPDDFELREGTVGVIDGRAPQHWRERAHNAGHGAFHGMKVVIYGALGGDIPGPDREKLTTIIKAGGGKVVSLPEALRSRTDLAIVRPDKDQSDAKVRQLLARQVPCAAPLYLVEWLAFPEGDLTPHLLFGSHPGERLQFLQQSRREVDVCNPEEDDPSTSDSL